MKEMICAVFGIIGAAIASLFGGWTASLTTLVIFMAIDYATGLLCAGVFHKSRKSETGALESRACLKGLVRKCMILLLVLVAHQLDVIIGTTYVKDAVCIAFISSETISITENAGLMGIPMPSAMTKALDILQKDKGTRGK
jgi:toxin secretion/phage lysis holin